MIKILHFISDTNIGGAGNLLCQQIKNMSMKQFEITIALPRNSALMDKIGALPCKIITCKHGKDRSFSVLSVIENCEIIKKVRPDIVHSHSSLSSRIAATLLSVPCRFFTKHCAFEMQQITKNPILKRISGTINNTLSTSIIAVSDSARNRLIEMGCDPQKISTVVNGVSPIPALSDTENTFLREKYGLTKDNFVISYFARLEEYKGHKTLLDAAKICKKCHPNFRFFIIGTGAYEKELKRYTNELEIDDIVHFCGFLDDVAPIFNITDINLNCSYLSETASLSISEGMSLGIPCVASDIDGNSYMVKDGENGLLFPAKSYNSLSAALTRLYCDKELYKTCSNGALLRYHDELNDKKMCQKMTSIYLREYRKSKSKKYAKKINPLKL